MLSNNKTINLVKTSLRYNFHIGFQAKYLQLFAKKLMLGSRLKLSVINLTFFYYTFKNLMNTINFIFKLKFIPNFLIVLKQNLLYDNYFYNLMEKNNKFKTKFNILDFFTLYYGKWLGGTITNFKRLKILNNIPTLIIINDVLENIYVIRESKNLKIPLIGLIDSNINPRVVDFPLVLNTKSKKATIFIFKLFATFIKSKSDLKKLLFY